MVRIIVALCLAVVGAAVAGPRAVAQAIQLDGGGVGLALKADARTPASPTVESQAELTTTLRDLQASLQMSLQAGASGADQTPSWFQLPFSPAPVSSWDSRRLGLTAAWTPYPRAKVELSASEESRSAFSRADPYAIGSADHATRSRQDHAAAAIALDQLEPLHLQLGAEAALEAVDDIDLTLPGAPVPTTLATGTRRAFATLRWSPLPKLSLEGGGALDGVQVSWRGTGSNAASYGYLRPQLSGTYTPWTGGQWRVSVERAVSPPNPGAFASFVQAIDRPAGALFEPDHEWRYQASLQQAFAGGGSVSATFTRSVLQSVTELGPAGLIQAPMSIGGGDRRQVDLALKAPLLLPLSGLPALDVTGKVAWRTSQVTDPFTGERRPASGEIPYEAEVGLDQSLNARLRWGVKGQVVGARRLYQMSQVTTLSPTAGLGGYLAFTPGAFAIRLQADNFIGGGGATTDVFFVGSRAADAIDRVNQSHNLDRSVTISLSKPF